MRKVKVKRSRSEYLISALGGVIVILVGITMTPNFFGAFGTFGLLWVILGAVAVIYNGYAAFSGKGVPIYEMDVDTAGEGIEERLKKLDSLYQQGLITKEEWEEKRKAILNEL